MKKIVIGVASAFLACSIIAGTVATASSMKPMTSTSNVSMEYYFPRAGQAPEPVLLNLIKSAKSSVDMAIYSFTDTDISSALIAEKKKGITVRVITDRTEASGKYQKALLATLKKAGIPVKINSHSGLMHLKVTIVDKGTATTGSFNYTKGAETENDEVFVVVNNSTVAKNFDSEFVTMWNDTKDYKSY